MESLPARLDAYEFMGQVGEGSFSSVWKVMHKETSKIYACKIMPKANFAEPEDQERFQREINAMAFLRHPCLVAMHDFFGDDTHFYSILDFCGGGELFDFICENDKLDEPTAAFIFREIAQAVQYCHAFGVAHRDLKPENILIDKFPHVKVSDFGLCGYIHGQGLMGTFCGSPCYCSPECLSRMKYDGRKSDVWSLGVILFAMVTGEHPWDVENTTVMVRQIMKAQFRVPSWVSADCQDLIYGMMRVDPNDRLTVDEIMAHPWLKSASADDPELEMPALPAQPPTIEELAVASASNSQPVDHGILSPFASLDQFVPLSIHDGAQLEVLREAMPKLRLSASLIHLDKAAAPEASPRRRDSVSPRRRNHGWAARTQHYISNAHLFATGES